MSAAGDRKYGAVRIEAVTRCGMCRGEGTITQASSTGRVRAGGAGLVSSPCTVCDGVGEIRTPVLLPGEPFFLIRGKDKTAPVMVDLYKLMAEQAWPDERSAVDLVTFLASLTERRDLIIQWQRDNPGQVRAPD